MRWWGNYLINIILSSSPLLIAWILDLIALTTPLVDLTEVVDKGLATGWSAAGLAKCEVGLGWHGIPEKKFAYLFDVRILMVFWEQTKTAQDSRMYWIFLQSLHQIEK